MNWMQQLCSRSWASIGSCLTISSCELWHWLYRLIQIVSLLCVWYASCCRIGYVPCITAVTNNIPTIKRVTLIDSVLFGIHEKFLFFNLNYAFCFPLLFLVFFVCLSWSLAFHTTVMPISALWLVPKPIFLSGHNKLFNVFKCLVKWSNGAKEAGRWVV